MKLKYALKFIFVLFCVITTFQVLFIGIINTVLGSDIMFSMQALLQLPLISFAGVLPVLLFVRGRTKNPPSRTTAIILQALHFILTSGAVFGLLIYFKWLDATNAALIIAFFLGIYIPAYIFQELRDRKLARQLNERINAFHNNDNATHLDKP